MEIFKGFRELARPLQNSVVTIGNFDGVHIGHQYIVKLATKRAHAIQPKVPAIAYVFRPHPRVILNPGEVVPLLTGYDEKTELLAKYGIDIVIEEPFTRDFSETTADQFFNEIVIKRLHASDVVVGHDFGFGSKRAGHLKELEFLCARAGVELTIVPPQMLDGETISSSKIRALLGAGDLAAANKLLGREFSYRGEVIHGENRGAGLGFPTANLKVEDKLMLPFGVYSSWMVVDGKRLPGVTNVGVRPTFGEGLPALVESHLLDRQLDLYGKNVELQFVERLREEKKFSGVEELKAQIAQDVGVARISLGVLK